MLKKPAFVAQKFCDVLPESFIEKCIGLGLCRKVYFTLATSSVPRDRLPKKYVRGLPPYDLPLILLALLAVDKRFGGRGLGHALTLPPQNVSLSKLV